MAPPYTFNIITIIMIIKTII